MPKMPLFAVLMPVLLIACATQPPEPLSIESVEEVSATVTSVDMATRMVALRGPAGEAFTIQAGPDVRNLAQVKVGDRVVARYYEAVGAELTTSEADTGGTVVLGGRANAGERPAGGIGTLTTVPVTISAVDTKNNVVTFYGEDGLVRTLDVKNPDAQVFIRKLKAGDRVTVSFTEAIAVSVEPAR